MDKKHVGKRVKLARIFYEQRTGNKMTQEILAKTIGAKRGTTSVKQKTSALGAFLFYSTKYSKKIAPPIKVGFCYIAGVFLFCCVPK